jgi:hypothetical protein
LLRPYMHGFFMKINLYQKALKVNTKMEKTAKKTPIKTEYLQKETTKEEGEVDDRFKEMLSNPDFGEITEEFY